eukprot:COSAG02_NODE_987_length_15443_cov_8.132625_15_plen_51_part_00
MNGALQPAAIMIVVLRSALLGFYRDGTRTSAVRCGTVHTIILHCFVVRLH